MRDHLAGYFDTRLGRKTDPDSYRGVADEIDPPPEHLLYITDNFDEARAARLAGLNVAISARPQNPDLDPHDLPTIDSFGEV